MKKNLILLILIFSINTIYSQDKISVESEVIDRIIGKKEYIPQVKGQLLNYSAEKDKDLIIKYVTVVPLRKRQETRIARIESDGIFELEIERGLPYQQIWLSIGDYYYGEILANKDLEIIDNLKKIGKKKV